MSLRKNLKIYVVDDDAAVLHSLSALLSAHGLDPIPYKSAEDFVNDRDPKFPGCVLLDIKMPGMSGLDLQDLLSEQGSPLPIIILTGHGDIPAAVRAMKKGAIDFIEKPVRAETLLSSIEDAICHLENNPRPGVPKEEIQRRLSALTARESEVLENLVLGKTNKQIAIEFGISERTIEIHRSRIQRKMDAHSLAELIKLTG